ncbi:hypothetical protein [Pleurocapsa sp. PCC 7319]|uniref:hypothetical protein n=1 Tax=Pleurocapsa sp. PCC 7319 TaxID=118161 RepID=UPI00034B7636|nr:hypothetical protein [Pleurocapsa sp. PCC 7319]
MKPKISLKNNLSLKLVTFLAAVFSTVFYTAIGNAATRQQPKIKTSQLKLFKQQYLIAQTWSNLDSEQLSLGNSNPQPSNLPSETLIESDELLIDPLDLQQQQLIAQTWSDLDSEQLSLGTSSQENNLSSDSILERDELINIPGELNQEQQLVAQTWTNIESEQLSLAEPSDRLRAITTPTEINTEPKPQSKPIINPPDKREIAARLTLQKVQIIAPAPGVILDKNHNDSVTIQYPPSTSVKLKVNGAELDESLVTQQQQDSRRNLITKTWKGADLRNGANTLSLIASKDGIKTRTTQEVMVKDTSALARSEENSESSPSSDNSQNSSDSDSEVEITKPSNNPPNSADIVQPESKPLNENKPQPNAKGKSKKQSVKILNPTANSVLDTIHSSVIIQYPKSASVILQVNGKSVDSAQVGRTLVNPVSHEVTQTWYGVIFATGVNTLSVLSTTDGVNYSETSIQVTVPGRPEALKVETVEAEIPADGRAIATVKGRFVDQFGTTTPWNEIITLHSSGGKFIGTDLEPDIPGFQVQPEKGEFTAALQASYNAKTVRIRAKSNRLEGYTQTKFKTTLREQPLLTGFANIRIGARGTDYYDSFRDFLPLDEDNNAEIDLDSAAFISGSFRRWSYTGAFNSDRPLNDDNEGENRLFRTYADSEQDYPVLGDSSSTEVTTPSIDNVYFRLERNPLVEFADPDYFMWGDYRTEEFNTEAQEFSAISRQLHGFKSNYNLGNFQFNALYANNTEGFQRDAISPDGTSGFYFLSRRLLVPGSEDIYIELSPLNDPGNVVSRQRLSLGTDYEINYDRGTLLFNDPLLRTEIAPNGDILVRRIVATYQFESEARDSTLLAGRGRYHFDRDLENPIWLGATYLNEHRGDHDFELWGFDSYVSLGNWGNLIAEYAQSDNQTIFANADGSAYRLEGEVKFSNKIRGRAYYREADEGFANNATLSFIPGQTRYGSQIQAQVSESTELQFSYEHQDNQGVAPRPLDELEEFLDSGFTPVPGNTLDNSLTTITAGVEQKIGEGDLGVDVTWRDRSDRKSPEALDSTSTQLRSRFSMPIIDKLNFHALNDLTLSNNTDTVFSDRIGLGLDWEFYSGLSLVLNHQWFTRGNLAGEALTSLGLQGEYEPWANATLTGRYSLTNGEDSINNIGSIGLQQKVTIASGLNLDFDYEHTFSGFDSTSSGRQFSQPFAVGQGASSLGFSSGSTYGVGIEYTDNPNFTASARWQHSDNSSGGNTVLSADVTGKLSSALTSQFTYNQASSANQEFDIGTSRNLRLGLAYRNPQQDKFNALLRYEYEENGGTLPETILLGKGTGSQEHLFGVEAIYAPNWRWEFYGKYAFRHSKTFLADDFVGSSNISLGQLRTTYRLNYHMDIVAEGRMIWQPSADYTESGVLLEAGYYVTPELRLALGYVFGSADDDDFTGTRSAGGPYVGMTIKLNSLLDGFGQHRAPSVPEAIPKKQKPKKKKTHSEVRRQESEDRSQKTGDRR